MKKSNKLAIIAAALLAVAPVATGLENVSGNADTVLAAKKSKKKAKRVKKSSKKRAKRSKRSKKAKKSKKRVKLLPFLDGQKNYSFKGWKVLGTNPAGYAVAYTFVKVPGKGNTPYVQFVLINPKTSETAFVSAGYDLKTIMKAPKDKLFMIPNHNGQFSYATSVYPSEITMVKKAIKANF